VVVQITTQQRKGDATKARLVLRRFAVKKRGPDCSKRPTWGRSKGPGGEKKGEEGPEKEKRGTGVTEKPRLRNEPVGVKEKKNELKKD